MPDARPEATTEEVARWVAAVQTMTAGQLSDFDRRTCRAYQHHSLIDLIRAIVVRREQLERASWFRIKPTYRKPAGGFLAIGPLYRGEVVRAGAAIRFEWGDGAWIETVPIEHVEVGSGAEKAAESLEVAGARSPEVESITDGNTERQPPVIRSQ